MVTDPLRHALFVGPQRTGTSWLYEYFRLHPQVCVSEKVKETFYFDRHYERGYSWYDAHFLCNKPDQRIRIEIGTTYFHDPLAPARVLETLGQVPVVITLRDPLERLVSLFYHLKRYGHLPSEITLSEAATPGSYLVQTSLYGTHVQRWQQTFGVQHVMVFFQEDLDLHRDAFLHDLAACLGIDFLDPTDVLPEKINTAALPANQQLSNTASGLARLLRKTGLYGLVNLAKKIGLKQLLLAGKKPDTGSEKAFRELKAVAHILLQEVELTEQLLQKDLDIWKIRIRKIMEN